MIDEAFNNNDAAALAAFFTEDAVQVTPEGPIYGREAIEKQFADLFTQIHVSEHINKTDRPLTLLVRLATRYGGTGNGVLLFKARAVVLYNSRAIGQQLMSVRAMVGRFGC